MQKIYYLLLFMFVTGVLKAQVSTSELERPPVFSECKDVSLDLLSGCFKDTLTQFLIDNFEVPSKVIEDDYVGQVAVLFEVTKEGEFKVLHAESVYKELKEEVQSVFNELPVVDPATYGGNSTFMQFMIPIKIPLSRNIIGSTPQNQTQNSGVVKTSKQSNIPVTQVDQENNPLKKEYDAIKNLEFKREQKFKSQLNIPFSHQVYSRFDRQLNLVGTNSHTASKPFLYDMVDPYYDFEAVADSLDSGKTGWWGRKWSDEHMVRVQGEDYWFALDPAADLQLGTETDDLNEDGFTYNNTRAVFVQGGLGEKLNFFAAVYESQGRFPEYFERFARSLRPDGGNPAIIPGRGIAKEGRNGDLDYPTAEGYISYTSSKYFNLQLGHGKQFIGDGYRSLLLSDNASYYPYLKLNTTFWKIKYTNTWTSLRDVRPEVTADGAFKTKFMANHYLSWNVSKKLNLGFFESVIWDNENGRGFDANFLNPVIFYRAIEFSTGSRGGNALIGLSGKYKFSDRVNVYSQIVIDEFSTSAFTSGEQDYRNKHGVQLGLKYYNAFGIPNLTLQGEYNQVRPYTYSNNEIELNFGHANQSLAHQWGANFKEYIAIVRYERDRWYGTGKLILGSRGLEIGDINETFFGGSIFGNDENRPSDTGIEFFQGNRADTFYGDVELGYLINPATNLKVYANAIYRDFDTEIQDVDLGNFDTSTLWLNIGFRTDLFNSYYDY